MLYAPVQAKDYWPLEWEKCFNMHKHLNQFSWNYQFILEKKMFAAYEGPEYMCVLVKWVESNVERKRDVLLETDDPKQMEAALLMLINEAEAQAKERQRVSMVP